MILGRRRLQERWTFVRGLRTFARVSEAAQGSDRPPLVLVHGLGVSSRYMVPLALELARDFAVYAPDLPGFGRSERPPKPLDIDALGEALDLWMEANVLTRALVVANSMGCQIVVELAARRSETICGAVLIGPTMDRTAAHPLSQIVRLLLDQFREPFGLVPLQAFDYLTNGPVRTIQTFREALRHDMLGRIEKITSPAVVMRGGLDPIASQVWVEQLVARMAHARLVVTPGAGHALNYSAPREVAAVVRDLADSL